MPPVLHRLTPQEQGELGTSIVIKGMIERQIVPCRPAIDVGYDIIAVAGDFIWKVQVKTTRTKRFQFSTSRGPAKNETARRKYQPGTVDIFACVALETEDIFFFMDSLDTTSVMSFRPGCANHNAWHLFWGGMDATARKDDHQ